MREFRSRRDREMEVNGYIQACEDISKFMKDFSIFIDDDTQTIIQNRIQGLIMKERSK